MSPEMGVFVAFFCNNKGEIRQYVRELGRLRVIGVREFENPGIYEPGVGEIGSF